MDESTRRPSYWAVLPASVRYDPDLPSSAKILYAELSALAESYGYAWPTNDYFERLYGVSERSVIRWLQALEAAGYIRIEGAGTTARKIWCGINPLREAGGGPPGDSTPTDKNVSGTDKNVSGTDKNVSPTINKQNKQKRGTDPPKPPREGRRRKKLTCSWAPEMFERFWTLYPRGDDKAGARYEWDALQPDPELMREMSAALKRQMQTEEWRRGVGIPYACRWLRDRRWEDEIKSPPAAEALPHEKERDDIEWEN